ncbi:MAG: hypothetical protein XD60_1251 [Acetothermia bacterium 64_32]|nr:MAG: hypothetical protein XD60_1251 [Acetothermia bacterium 64_32]HAF71043.1 hypothetical protein [Candidatus Acetothermia bacterium]
MKGVQLFTLVTGVMLGAGCISAASTDTCRVTSTFTIPAALELHTYSKQPSLVLEVHAGELAKEEFSLRVGTNDWPLDLYLGLVFDGSPKPEFEPFYQFVRGQELGPTWVSVPVFSYGNPVDQLPYPAWTDYTLGIMVNPPEGTAQGTYRFKLRLLLRSSSGLIQSLDIPVEVIVR